MSSQSRSATAITITITPCAQGEAAGTAVIPRPQNPYVSLHHPICPATLTHQQYSIPPTTRYSYTQEDNTLPPPTGYSPQGQSHSQLHSQPQPPYSYARGAAGYAHPHSSSYREHSYSHSHSHSSSSTSPASSYDSEERNSSISKRGVGRELHGMRVRKDVEMEMDTIPVGGVGEEGGVKRRGGLRLVPATFYPPPQQQHGEGSESRSPNSANARESHSTSRSPVPLSGSPSASSPHPASSSNTNRYPHPHHHYSYPPSTHTQHPSLPPSSSSSSTTSTHTHPSRPKLIALQPAPLHTSPNSLSPNPPSSHSHWSTSPTRGGGGSVNAYPPSSAGSGAYSPSAAHASGGRSPFPFPPSSREATPDHREREGSYGGMNGHGYAGREVQMQNGYPTGTQNDGYVQKGQQGYASTSGSGSGTTQYGSGSTQYGAGIINGGGPPPIRIKLRRKKRGVKGSGAGAGAIVIPLTLDPTSPTAVSGTDTSFTAYATLLDVDHEYHHTHSEGSSSRYAGPSDDVGPYRTVKIEVSGTKEGKLIYELDIPESMIKYDAPMPTSPYDPHPCILCGQVFVSERHMNRHMLTHTDIKPYTCDKCYKPFARPDSMVRHRRNVHGLNENGSPIMAKGGLSLCSEEGEEDELDQDE